MKLIILGIRQIGKAVDSESIIYRFEPCMPNDSYFEILAFERG